MKSKLIVIMIDGISSDYFIEFPQFMPHTHALASGNTVITNLEPEKCGSSLPGRTSMLTGKTSREHGIYGNNIWDPSQKSFRYASPYDIRTPTLFTQAKKAGLDTANIGFGMIRPEDCTLYTPPHWVGDFISRNRDNKPVAISPDWKQAMTIIDDGRLKNAKSRLTPLNAAENALIESSIFKEMILDQQMIQLVNEIVKSSQAPDLIFTEINVTDSVQHQFGYASTSSNFAIAFADMLVGLVVHNLKIAGIDSDYSIIVTSDHGHADTEKALYVDNIIDKQNWNSECSVLFLENDSTIDQSINALHSYGAQTLNDEFLPKDIQGQILALAMKEKVSFEKAPNGNSAKTGISKYKSSHSYYPGTQADKRFAVLSGPSCKNNHIQQASGEQFYQLMNNILDLEQ